MNAVSIQSSKYWLDVDYLTAKSQHLHEQLQSAGGSSELIIVPGGGHGPGVMIPEYYEKMVTFFKGQIH